MLLSGGADFTLHILPAELPSSSPSTPARIQPARSLSGHTRAISNTAIIARGRNVLSASLDGTIRLWDVGSGQAIRTLSSARGPILGMSLGERNGVSFGSAPSTNGTPAVNGTEGAVDEREVETQDKLVFCSLQNGTLECFDLGSKRCVFQSQRSSVALQAISYSASHQLVATGSSKGVVDVYDVRSGLSGDSVPLVSFTRNNASIEDICFTSNSGNEGEFTAFRPYPYQCVRNDQVIPRSGSLLQHPMDCRSLRIFATTQKSVLKKNWSASIVMESDVCGQQATKFGMQVMMELSGATNRSFRNTNQHKLLDILVGLFRVAAL